MPKRAREILIEDELPLNSANTEFLYNKEDGALYYRDRLDAEWVSVLGEPGNDGDNGLSATIQVGTVTTGSPGSSAAVSNTGTNSNAIFNFTIPRGDTGPAGPAGASAGFVEAIDVHNSDTTNVHGIADTSLLATKSYADNAASTAVTNLIDSAPDALNTLNELAAALNDDANFSTTVTNALAGKLSIASASATYATKNELDSAGLNPFFLVGI
jgi:hypothetical protein